MYINRYNRKDRWFILKKKLKVEEYILFDQAALQNDILLIVMQSFNEFFSPHNGGFNLTTNDIKQNPIGSYWTLSSFTFFDKEKNVTKYKINEWILEEIQMTYKSSNRTAFIIYVTDPKQRLNKITCSFNKLRKVSYDDIDMDIVKKAILKLNEVSKFNYWEEYYLMQKNEELMNKINDLEDEIDNLKKAD